MPKEHANNEIKEQLKIAYTALEKAVELIENESDGPNENYDQLDDAMNVIKEILDAPFVL